MPIYIMKFFFANVNKNMITFSKIFAIIRRIVAFRRHGHDTAEPDMRENCQLFGEIRRILGQNAALLRLPADIDLDETVHDLFVLCRLPFDLLGEGQAVQ